MNDQPSLFVLGSFVVACSARVGRLPGRGESAQAEHFIVEPGGKGFNLATAARRLGANVHSIFSIGDDVFAQTAEPAFAAAGFAPTRLRRCAGQTGSGIGFIDATGETCLAVYPGANLALVAEDVDAVADAVCAAQVVLAQFEIGDAPIAAAFALARRSGRTETILNPSPFRMPSDAILRHTTMLVVNEVEAMALGAAFGCAAPLAGQHLDPSVLSALFARGPDTIVVTRGAAGATAYTRDAMPLVQPAFAVEAVDTLGAGDAFLAALGVALAQGAPLAASLRQAAAAGALATLTPGVFDALATRRELQTFLADRHDQAHQNP